ncbi:peptidoglycan-binding domain-containing protein [Streptomyces sp. NPDC007851]|uniref:peptidoglycan-binding domain-containing protein n=1 Tax=Streptomyces sp. NPDC007851 TaxID=3155008 RepID=UPI0033E0A232
MRWRQLPETLDPDSRRLVQELRRLKDHSGLTLQVLQAKTPFSGSSWERYLNGKALPPAAAVEAPAGLTDADASRLLALRDAAQESGAVPERPHRVAETARQQAVVPSGPASASHVGLGDSRDRDQRPERIHWVALSVVGGALLLSAVVSGWLIADRPNAAGRPSGTATGVGRYSCAYVRHGDLMLAGNSTTNSRLVALNSTGPDVAEVQCLLRRHHLSPGDVDGYFGKRTEAQVKTLQQQDHVSPDGIVGEQTWSLLRHVE